MTKKILIGLFIPAMLLATVAFAQTGTPPAPKKNASFDIACVQGAIDKRDTAIIAAWDAYTASAKAAVEARKTALKSAWTITNAAERKTSIKKAWTDYKNAIGNARKTFNQTRKMSWQQFRTDRKACKGVNPSDDTTSESVDVQL